MAAQKRWPGGVETGEARFHDQTGSSTGVPGSGDQAMAKNHGSAVFQVQKALKAVFTPGESRHAGKRDGTASGRIYSIGAMKTYLSCGIVFAKWVRDEYGEKFIGRITPGMVEQFVRSFHARDLSHATVNKYVAAIAKLDAGLRAVGWRDRDALPLVSAELYSRHADARPAPFTSDEARQVGG
jgi:hypothetical protein